MASVSLSATANLQAACLTSVLVGLSLRVAAIKRHGFNAESILARCLDDGLKLSQHWNNIVLHLPLLKGQVDGYTVSANPTN